ncbi:hypothetical protein PGB90_000848 [Kerria lacca]
MTIQEHLEKYGYAVIEDFLTEKEIFAMKEEGKNMSKEGIKRRTKSLFSGNVTQPQASDRYFIESANNISFFYETQAFNEDGTFKCDPEISLNKVGHAIHRLNSVFAQITFHEKIKNICRKLKMKKPAVIQSMYIYKNPKIGGQVNAHQDASYLYTEPSSLYGFWIALDDATEENGCLSFIPESHNNNVRYRFKRNPNKNSEKLCITEGCNQVYNDDEFKSLPVKKGTCVIIHGNVVHRSSHNYSDKTRHAYTFHIYDSARSVYSKDNWLQAAFQNLYEN